MPGNGPMRSGCPPRAACRAGVIAVIPGQIGIGVYSPPIDSHGNSVRGIRVCQDISDEFELHALTNRTNVRSVIRREYRGVVVRSKRIRTPEERSILAREGRRVAVLGGARGAVLRLDRATAQAHYAACGRGQPCHIGFQAGAFGRYRSAETSSARGTAQSPKATPSLAFAELLDAGVAGLAYDLANGKGKPQVRVFSDADAALEWCEPAH